MIREMWEEGWAGRSLLFFFALFLVLTPIFIWSVVEESSRWDAFKREHDCRVVGRMSGDVITTVGPNLGGGGGVSVGVGSTPSKTGWQCDDGVTYWR